MKDEKCAIQIVAISGSVRPGNFTSHALNLVIDEFRQHPDVGLEVIDPATVELPLPGRGNESPATQRVKAAVAQATGVVLATPEYHGSYSSVIKLVIENLGFPSVLAGKPVAMLGVAAGRIGAIKALENLSSVCSHVGALVLPGPVSVARVRQVFDKDGRCQDEQIEAQIRTVATNLIDYIERTTCPKVTLEAMVRRGTA